VNLVKKIDKILEPIERLMITLLLAAMVIIVFWAVINRFILKVPLAWSEEISKYLSIWAAFFGASLGVKRRAHIGVEAFVGMLPKTLHKYVSFLTTAICFIFGIALAYIGFGFCAKLAATGQLSPAMRIPIMWAYAAVPAGGALMALRYAMVFVEDITDLMATTKQGRERI
jgi:C4-dicarboxylate transporter DctQ subunit